MPERCSSPICNNEIEPEGENWRRTPKKFCSDQCKTEAWAIRKTADLLSGFPNEKKIEILSAISSRNNQCEINGDNHCEITVENQRGINMPKAYVCRTWPQLTIGRVRFHNGLLRLAIPSFSELLRGLMGLTCIQTGNQHVSERRNTCPICDTVHNGPEEHRRHL